MTTSEWDARARLGQVLRGKYRLDRVLGEGGMAVVYEATHRNRARFAVKVLHPELSRNAQTRSRFLSEGYAANSVKHPNAVFVVDDDVADDGSAFLVMELLDGLSCNDLGPQASVDVACAILLQLLDVLAAAHDAGIIHRDIKPANLFLTVTGRVKVLDFGIARVREAAITASATRSGVTLGTPAFMSPEQAQGEARDVDGRTDLWSAGATFFWLVSGEFVHAPAESAVGLLVAAATTPPRSVAAVAPGLPPAVIAVVDRAIAFRADDRWPNAKAMRDALAEACRESVSASEGDKSPEGVVATALQARIGAGVDALPPRRIQPQPPATSGSVVFVQPQHVHRNPRRGEIGRDEPRPVRELDAEVPESLAAIVDRGLQNSPDDRYPSARRVTEALKAVVSQSRPPLVRWPLYVSGATVLVVVAALVGWNSRSTPTAARAPSATLDAPSASTRTVRMTDLPPERTSSPEAAREFALAMQSFRDASQDLGRVHLRRAMEIDPSFAAAHVEMANWDLSSEDATNREVALAWEQRAQLGDRNLALLEASRATLARNWGFSEEGWPVWRAVADRFPLDYELVSGAGIFGLFAGHELEATQYLERGRVIDPKGALVDAFYSLYWLKAADLERAGAAADRCLALSPMALDCLGFRAQVAQRLGQCDKMEEAAREMVAADPRVSRTYRTLAEALMARGAPAESVAEAWQRARELETDPKARAFRELHDPIAMDLAAGDFEAVVASFPRLDAYAATQSGDLRVGQVFQDEALTLDEMGQTGRALAVADAYMKRLPALTRESDHRFRHIVLRERRRYGRMPDADFRAEREAWTKDYASFTHPRFANARWLVFYAEAAASPLDAREALDALPQYSPLPRFDGFVWDESVMGHVLRLAGRVDEAISHLRRAVATCLDPHYIFDQTWAAEELGEALEAKGDKDGACAAYAAVLARWGHAKPRSVTADAARARAKKLGCP
jgi:serine/threonine-protein kinase